MLRSKCQVFMRRKYVRLIRSATQYVSIRTGITRRV